MALAALLAGSFMPAVDPPAVSVVRTVTLYESEEHINFPWACRGPEGFISFGCSIGQHTVTERGMRLISEDDGETWTTPDTGTVSGMGALLGDGRAAALSCWGPKANGDGSFPVKTRFYAEGGRRLDETVEGTMVLPIPLGPHFHRTMLEMPDGALLATIYGHQEGHKNYTSALVRTEDGGQHWEMLSVIAHSEDVGTEGYCEPVIERLANGDLLCAMRVGGPLHTCRSTDGGATWSTPTPVADHGVDPDLLLMSNGVLVLSYGRPNVELRFSHDGTGETWTEPLTVYRGMGCHYSSLIEAMNGELIVFFSQSGFGGAEGPGPLNMMRMARLRVAPGHSE